MIEKNFQYIYYRLTLLAYSTIRVYFTGIGLCIFSKLLLLLRKVISSLLNINNNIQITSKNSII